MLGLKLIHVSKRGHRAAEFQPQHILTPTAGLLNFVSSLQVGGFFVPFLVCGALVFAIIPVFIVVLKTEPGEYTN